MVKQYYMTARKVGEATKKQSKTIKTAITFKSDIDIEHLPNIYNILFDHYFFFSNCTI